MGLFHLDLMSSLSSRSSNHWLVGIGIHGAGDALWNGYIGTVSQDVSGSIINFRGVDHDGTSSMKQIVVIVLEGNTCSILEYPSATVDLPTPCPQ